VHVPCVLCRTRVCVWGGGRLQGNICLHPANALVPLLCGLPPMALCCAAPMAFPFDGERVVDDFVMLTILCGNDFIPHLPSLDIGEGAMDIMLRLYR
jgi:hypothetical protein